MTKRKLTKRQDDIRRGLATPQPYDGIHTCSKGCKKQGCNRGLRDTIEEQNAQIEALKQDLLEKTAAVRQVTQDNKTETEATRIENAHLKAEVERLKEGNDCLGQMHDKEMERSAYLLEEFNRTTAWGRGLESDLSHARVEISFLKAEVERLRKADGWQPMEMAPFDTNIRIIICTFDDEVEIIYSSGQCHYREREYPKYWMPVPTPPKEGKPSV